MKIDTLDTYLKLRQQLQQEKTMLEARVHNLSQALALPTTGAPAPARVVTRTPVSAAKAAGRKANKLSLSQAVVRVTSGKPMTKEEILAAVQKIGYRFQAKDPVTSLNPVLYGKKPKFSRQNGKFSPAPAAVAKAAPVAAAKPVKRTMSAAARAKLAAIAKARWAKAKKAGKAKL